MATLPTNFKDDILDTSVNTRRRYRVYENTDGTIELEDVTEYSQVGDEFGAGQINATNTEVNKKFDKNMIVRDLNIINAITKEGYAPDALALKEVNDSLGGVSQFIVDETTGKITGYKTEIGGADTVFPFSSEKLAEFYYDNFIGRLTDYNKTFDFERYGFTHVHFDQVIATGSYDFGDGTGRWYTTLIISATNDTSNPNQKILCNITEKTLTNVDFDFTGYRYLVISTQFAKIGSTQVGHTYLDGFKLLE